MKKFIPSIETYLLRTGKFRLYFGAWFRTRYNADIGKLLEHYNRYRAIEEGLNPYHTFEVMYLAHGWSYDHYYKITLVMLYLDMLQPTRLKHERMSYLRTLWPLRMKEGGVYAD